MVRDGSDHDCNEYDDAEVTKEYHDILDEIEELSPASRRGGEGGGEMEGGLTEIEVFAQCKSTHACTHAHVCVRTHTHTLISRRGGGRMTRTHARTHAHTRTCVCARAH